MNFLGHAVLSFGDDALLTGNLISDFVKGKAMYDYTGRLLDGIRLHRSIDSFTDAHPATRRMMDLFRPHYRLYCGPICDIVYDYLLANDTNELPDLLSYSLSVYRSLHGFEAELPPRFRQVLTYMERDNWLYNYRHLQGLERSLTGLSRRASAMPGPEAAMQVIRQHEAVLRELYSTFFPDVKRMAKEKADTRIA